VYWCKRTQLEWRCAPIIARLLITAASNHQRSNAFILETITAKSPIFTILMNLASEILNTMFLSAQKQVLVTTMNSSGCAVLKFGEVIRLDRFSKTYTVKADADTINPSIVYTHYSDLTPLFDQAAFPLKLDASNPDMVYNVDLTKMIAGIPLFEGSKAFQLRKASVLDAITRVLPGLATFTTHTFISPTSSPASSIRSKQEIGKIRGFAAFLVQHIIRYNFYFISDSFPFRFRYNEEAPDHNDDVANDR